MSALRPPMLPVARRVRAFFAPVARVTETPAIFDPALHGAFALDAPPAPWLDLGWIENLRRLPGTRLLPVRGGAKGATTSQVRVQLDAHVEFEFREWGKLQMALAGGSQHMNALSVQGTPAPKPAGGTPAAAIALQSGSTAGELMLGAAVGSFAAGDLVTVDLDYTGQTGYVGTGLSAAYVKSATDVGNDANYIRRVSFNVARIASLTANSALLAQPLLGGAPPANAKVQKVTAFLDREGGSFFQEWSALFVLAEESGGRICFFYPRLQPAAPAGEQSFEVAQPLVGNALRAAFLALPYTDSADSEQVACYRSYFPAATAALY